MDRRNNLGSHMDGFSRQVRRPANVPARHFPAISPVKPITLTVTPLASPAPAMSAPGSTLGSKQSRRHWKRNVVAATLLVLVVIGGILGFKAVLATQRIVTRNAGSGAPALAGTIDPTKLKGEGDGRINILMLGVGGSGHDGGSLSDTIMVASIDPHTKNVAMLSIPRDLYVKIPGHGYGKINAANSYGGPDLAKQVVSSILDLPIHYYMQVDFAGFKQAVDAVGGVDILNTASLYDSDYPCDNGHGSCVFKLAPGQYHMDGALALKYSRCRHGACGSDFGRAARQQEVLVALRQKALEASTLTNPVKLSGLIDSVGGHVKTDLQINEMQKLAQIICEIDVTKVNQKVLDETPQGLLVPGGGQFPGAGSIELPKAGPFDYSEIQQLVHSIFVDGYLKQENAALGVQNGTSRAGLAAAVSKQLTAYNYYVVAVGSAPEASHTTSVIYDYTGGKKPYTIKYLESRFGVKAQSVSPPAAVAGQPAVEISVIVGNDYRITIPIAQP